MGPFFLKFVGVVVHVVPSLTPSLDKYLMLSTQTILLKKTAPGHAYIYAFFTFVRTVVRSLVDLQHLLIGRRAMTRVRSELMASIYDKALKREDFSGIMKKQDPS
jgi:hypothetical protein